MLGFTSSDLVTISIGWAFIFIIFLLAIYIAKRSSNPNDYGIRPLIIKLIENIVWLWNEIIERPVIISIVVFIFATLLVVFFSLDDYKNDDGFWLNIKVEAHGMLFDILVIGILILLLNELGRKRLEIQRYKDEISDFRGWQSEEAAYRIRGNIKRLNRRNISAINLKKCNLSHIELNDVDLSKAKLKNTNFEGTELRSVKFSEASVNGTSFLKADLTWSIFENTRISRANFSKAILKNANFWRVKINGSYFLDAKAMEATFEETSFFRVNLKDADLRATNFKKAEFLEVNLQGADVSGGIFEGAKFFLEFDEISEAIFMDTDLRGTWGLEVETLCRVKTLYGTQLDPELKKQVKERCPHLLEKPGRVKKLSNKRICMAKALAPD